MDFKLTTFDEKSHQLFEIMLILFKFLRKHSIKKFIAFRQHF